MALVLSAALVFVLLFLTGVVTVEEFADNPEVRTLADATRDTYGSLRGGGGFGDDSLVPGVFDPRGVDSAGDNRGRRHDRSGACGRRTGLIYEGVERFILDSLLIVAGGVVAVLLKQALVHRRAPLV